MESLALLSDEKIIENIRKGDPEAANFLFNKYSSFVEKITKRYYIKGESYEDLLQEGYIGFYEAVVSYKIGSSLPFSNFAYNCIKRNIFDAIKATLRKKRQPQLETISLEEAFADIEKENRLRVIDQIITGGSIDPEDIVIVRCLVKEIVKILTSYERYVLKGYLEGKSYEEIARELNKKKKDISNCLQRARTKIKDYFMKEINK